MKSFRSLICATALTLADLVSGSGRRHQHPPKVRRYRHAQKSGDISTPKKSGDISTPKAVIDILLMVLSAAY